MRRRWELAPVKTFDRPASGAEWLEPLGPRNQRHEYMEAYDRLPDRLRYWLAEHAFNIIAADVEQYFNATGNIGLVQGLFEEAVRDMLQREQASQAIEQRKMLAKGKPQG